MKTKKQLIGIFLEAIRTMPAIIPKNNDRRIVDVDISWHTRVRIGINNNLPVIYLHTFSGVDPNKTVEPGDIGGAITALQMGLNNYAGISIDVDGIYLSETGKVINNAGYTTPLSLRDFCEITQSSKTHYELSEEEWELCYNAISDIDRCKIRYKYPATLLSVTLKYIEEQKKQYA